RLAKVLPPRPRAPLGQQGKRARLGPFSARPSRRAQPLFPPTRPAPPAPRPPTAGHPPTGKPPPGSPMRRKTARRSGRGGGGKPFPTPIAVQVASLELTASE